MVRDLGTKRIPIMLLVALLGTLAGCAATGKPPLAINQYALEYAPPAFAGQAAVERAIRVERFSVTQTIRTPMMVFRVEPFKYEVDHYNRWRAIPGDIVTDYLTRDLRASGLFRGVFSYQDLWDAPLVLQGAVEAFHESAEAGGNRAVLVLTVALLDLSRKDLSEKVVLQRTYRVEQPFQHKGPRGLAEAMSIAMATLSKQIIQDAYQALQGAAEPAPGR